MAYQSEIEKLEQRYRENPQQWFAALADSYRKAGDLDLALEVVRVGLEKRPNYVSGHIVKGRCLIDQKKDADAAAAFQRVLELDAENVIALKALSEISERAGGLDDSRRWLTRLLEVDPMNEEAQEALSKLPAPSSTETETPSAPTPTPTPTPAAPGAEVQTLDEMPPARPVEALSGLQPTAMEATLAERPSGEGFVIEKAEEADVTPPASDAPAVERVSLPEIETREFTPPGDQQEPMAGLEKASPEEPESAAAAPEMVVDEPAAEPEPAPVAADAGELKLIFPEDVAEEPAAERAPEQQRAPEPEPVVTETMAELYVRQGLLVEARDIYRQLVARRPGDGALAQRLAELEAGPTAPQPRRTSGRVMASSGPTVRDFLGDVFSGKPAASRPEHVAPPMPEQAPEVEPEPEPEPEPQPEPPPPSPMEAAFSEPAEVVRGAPTRRASDDVSLASVFGEDPPPVSTRPSQDKTFSFDEFFGAAPPKKTPTTRASQADQDKEPGTDEDDFKRWLKGLKS